MAEELFCKRLPITIKSSDREDRRTSVHLRMELHSVATPLHRKELVVRLTDEKDLFFLYTLRLSEEDFQSLKMQQGLLVDFGAFPQRFIDLLEMCIKEEHKESPKFVLHLESKSSMSGEKSAATLNIIETNPFKHLIHLSVRFLPGNDADIKKYLADCLKQFKETNQLLQQKLEHTYSDLSSQLQQAQETLATKSRELESLKTEWSTRLSEINSQHKEEMAAEKEKFLQAQSSYHQRLEQEKRDLEKAHTSIVKQLESRVYEMETANKDLTDFKYKSESTIRELRARLSGTEEELGRAKQEVSLLRKQNAALDGDFHQQEKVVSQLRTRVAVLEQELKDKEQVLTRSSDLLTSEQDKKHALEEELERRQREISKLEGKVKAMAKELMKGNEIIKKLQGENKNYHAKVKLGNQIAAEQEKTLLEKDKELEKMRQELSVTKDALRVKEDEVKKLSDSLETTTQKLEESRQLLKTNENVIQWLNKQINEQQIVQHRVGTFEMASVQSSLRPASAGLHNYSTSSYGSGASGDAAHLAGSQVMMPRTFANVPRQPQVQYHPGNQRKSALPMPTASRFGPPPPIPEEIRPHSRPSGNRSNASDHSSPGSTKASDKENDPPIDPKYLQKREDAIPVRGLLSASHSPPRPSSAPTAPVTMVTHNPNRIPPSSVVAKTHPPPLASAYFPGHGRPS